MSKRAALLFVLTISLMACGLLGGSGSIAANPTECPGPERHDFAYSISETFEVSYDEVMDWFCDGYEFTDILLALQTSRNAEYSADQLLEMTKTMTWEQIWEQTGILK